MVWKRAERFPCIPLNVFFSFNILIGCYSTNIWMNRIIPVAHKAAWKPSSFLHVPGSTCSPRLLKSTKTHLKSWQRARIFPDGELPLLEQKLRLISATRWLWGPLDLTQPLRSVASSVLHHREAVMASDPATNGPCVRQAPRVRNSLGIYYWILNSVQKMRLEKDCMEPCYCNNNLYSM